MKKSQIIGAVLALGVLFGMTLIPESIGLSRAGIHTIGVLIALIIALVTEPIPIGITCILGIPLCVIFGVSPSVSAALSGYTNHILFFILVSFAISEAVARVPLSQRLLAFLIRVFGTRIRRILLAIMVCAAALSSIMSNVATTAMLMSVVIRFLSIYEDQGQRRRSGRTFMIALPIASMIGGMITPAGSPLNLLGMDFLIQSGHQVTFLQWMLIGIPVSVACLLFAWLFICRVFPPQEVPEEQVLAYVRDMDIPRRMDFRERYVLVLVLILFTLWILSSWFPVLNITVVGIVGFAFLFLPKIEILSWREFTDTVSWSSFFLVGTMMTLGGALTENGVSHWLVGLLFQSAPDAMPVWLITLVISLVVFVLLIPIPIGPALISMLGAPFLEMAEVWGVSPVCLIMPLILCASNCYLLPLDTVPLLTYGTGYYKMTDMPKVSVAIQLFLALCLALWLPVSLRLIGF